VGRRNNSRTVARLWMKDPVANTVQRFQVNSTVQLPLTGYTHTCYMHITTGEPENHCEWCPEHWDKSLTFLI